MVEQDDLLRKALDVLERLGLRYMIVGSVASSVYGEPRATMDVDVVIDLAYGLVGEFCAAFPAPEFYLEPAAVRRAISGGGQFNLIQAAAGAKIDFMLVRYGTHQEGQLARRQTVRLLEDRDAWLARPEDVILSKMEYYREGESDKHLRDITGMLRVSPEKIDREYISRWSERLGLTSIWEGILRSLERMPKPPAIE